jgi:hypothetical protein
VVKEFLGLLFFSFKSECHKFKKKGFVLNEYEKSTDICMAELQKKPN